MNSFECLSRHQTVQLLFPTSVQNAYKEEKKIQVYENNNETQILTTIQTCNRNRRKQKKKKT